MMMRRLAMLLLILGCAASFALTVVAIERYAGYERRVVSPIKRDLIDRTREAAARIDASLAPARAAAQALARRLDGMPKPTEEALFGLLRTAIQSDPSFYGGTIAFEPGRFEPDRRLFAPYVAKKNGALVSMYIEDAYDYTTPESEWYGRALAEGDRWSEPYFDTSVGDIMMTTYSARFFGGEDDAPRGVVTIDLSMDLIRDIVRSVDLGGMGYAALVSRGGHYLYHPDEEVVLSGVGMLDVAERSGSAELLEHARRALEGGSGIADHASPLTGLASWFVYEPVAATGWSLVAVYTKADAPIDSGVLRQWLLLTGVCLVVFLATGTALVLRVLEGDRHRIWALSILVTALLVVGIGFTWRVALEYDSDADVEGSMVMDAAGLRSFQETSLAQAGRRHTDPPVFLETGLLVDSLRFDDRMDIQARGHIWQKYDRVEHADLERGVSLAGVVHVELGEPQTERVGGTEIVRWPFELTQRVRFENAKYPLMRERFALRVVPRQLARNVVLVPDLGAYPILSPAARPGLDENVYLQGWQVTRSFFELRERIPAADFGLGTDGTRETHPTLYFNVEVRKAFVDSFISNLVPLIIVGIVIFLVLLITERDEERITLMRTGVGFNLSICATLLFVTVFAHIGARQKVGAQQIVYLEYFYIVMYVAILWVAINSILYVRWPASRFIQYERNLFPQVLFWPITLGALWLLTLGTFY